MIINTYNENVIICLYYTICPGGSSLDNTSHLLFITFGIFPYNTAQTLSLAPGPLVYIL